MGIAAAAGAAATALGASAAAAAAVGTGVTALAVGVGGALLSKTLAGSPGAAPAAPAAPASTPAPVMNQAAINASTQQQAGMAAAASGRMSTVLSQSSGSDKLG